MSGADFSRRRFLRTASESLGVAWISLNWSDIAAAAHAAHAAARTPSDSKLIFFTGADAGDVEAVSAQIIPTDDTPGAREAGVVYFIDRALATFFSRLAAPFRANLLDFQSACKTAYPSTATFAQLSSDRQIEFLTRVERSDFFESMRLLTLFGMFSLPSYGGNRDHIGWKVLGFEDQHVFQPPFGYYDRDYPGFVIDPKEPT